MEIHEDVLEWLSTHASEEVGSCLSMNSMGNHSGTRSTGIDVRATTRRDGVEAEKKDAVKGTKVVR